MKRILISLIAITIFLVGCNQTDTNSYINEETPISQYQSMADYEIPTDLNALKNSSKIIVKVKALSDLGNDVIDGQTFGSKKKVKVLKSYGEEIQGEITIIEPAFVADGEYVATESYIKMLDGEEYILFLNEGDLKNEYAIVALGFGKYSYEKSGGNFTITDFSTFGEIKKYGFISNNKEEVKQYEVIRADVLKEYE
ncbi:hypothetical protein SAMN05216389_10664 [Oceanobacillus limi]|uniref:Lipoprotein n=1 Tax=Oceanobacillus limi TaxID=930131 RepID=A0A1I0C7K3_9BACI|nr:hypothetical protein [Oceanobacillus limi]SET15182.1 hypothetical protein SAMN05216389_10664 [Oceanobacillus limi]